MKYYLKRNIFFPTIEVGGKPIEWERIARTSVGMYATNKEEEIEVLDGWTKKPGAPVSVLDKKEYEVHSKKNTAFHSPQKTKTTFPSANTRTDPLHDPPGPKTRPHSPSSPGSSRPPVPVAAEEPKRSPAKRKTVVSARTKGVLPSGVVKSKRSIGHVPP